MADERPPAGRAVVRTNRVGSPTTVRPPGARSSGPRSSGAALGARAEAAARAHLEGHGLTLLAANWRNHAAGAGRCELDLVMREGDVAVIVEVRAQDTTRRGFAGHPAHTIGPVKQGHLARAGLAWLRIVRGDPGAWQPRALRFDVVTALSAPDGSLRLQWFRAAFSCAD
jgi:putative endonuclease